MTDFKKEIIEKLVTGELEIIEYQTNSDVEMIPNRDHFHICTSGKTVTLICQFKTPDKDRIKELEEENCKLRGKLDSLNEILNCLLYTSDAADE